MGCDWYYVTSESCLGFIVNQEELTKYKELLEQSDRYDFLTYFVYNCDHGWEKHFMIYDIESYDQISLDGLPGPHEIELEEHCMKITKSDKMTRLLSPQVAEMRQTFSLQDHDCGYWTIITSIDNETVEYLLEEEESR